MTVKDLLNDSGSDYDDNSDGDQSKTLIANCYSNDGASDTDAYQDCTDWDDFSSLAYEVTKSGGLMRVAAKKMAKSGSHHEWYSQLQVALAHYIADIIGQNLPNGEEPEGAAYLMEFMEFDAADIADYLDQNEEMKEKLRQALNAEAEAESESEETETESNDSAPAAGDD